MEIISKSALLTINETFFIQLISFLIFLVIINRVMVRPLRRTMGERTRYFDKIRLEIETAQQALDQKTREIAEQESDAKRRAWLSKEKIGARGLQEASVIVEQARQQITATQRQAEADIQLKISSEKHKIQKEVRALSLVIMEKILDRSLAA